MSPVIMMIFSIKKLSMFSLFSDVYTQHIMLFCDFQILYHIWKYIRVEAKKCFSWWVLISVQMLDLQSWIKVRGGGCISCINCTRREGLKKTTETGASIHIISFLCYCLWHDSRRALIKAWVTRKMKECEWTLIYTLQPLLKQTKYTTRSLYHCLMSSNLMIIKSICNL